MSSAWRIAALLGILLVFVVATGFETHTNFAGSVQLDYLAIPSRDRGSDIAFDGFTTELSLKMVADFGERASAQVKVCYGCHGFEVGMAYLDFWAFDELSLRVGRMNPRFGDFPVRHDPANHRANSKPLPYDMGRMLRRSEWNNGIMPIPYVDNGAELYGTIWLGDAVALDYAAHVTSGFEGGNAASDIDFTQTRTPALYYTDNNSQPAFGGRLSLTANLSDHVSLTLGASGIHGNYDPDAELAYTIVGADAHFRAYGLVLRGEVLHRRTEIGTDPSALRFAPTGDEEAFVKQGFYLELEYPFASWLEVFVRWDGLRRFGNLPSSSALRRESAILRYTPGVNLILHRSVRLKLSAELWDFSDFSDELAVHMGVVGNF